MLHIIDEETEEGTRVAEVTTDGATWTPVTNFSAIRKDTTFRIKEPGGAVLRLGDRATIWKALGPPVERPDNPGTFEIQADPYLVKSGKLVPITK